MSIFSTQNWFSLTFFVLVALCTRDWKLFAPGCGYCGAKRREDHGKGCPFKEKK